MPRTPEITVLRLNPVASLTLVGPPRPNTDAIAPATNRRCRSSSNGPTDPKNLDQSSRYNSTTPRYSARLGAGGAGAGSMGGTGPGPDQRALIGGP